MSWDLTIGVNQPKEPGGLCLPCGLQRSWASNFFPEKMAWSIQLSQIITGTFVFTPIILIMTGMLITVHCF